MNSLKRPRVPGKTEIIRPSALITTAFSLHFKCPDSTCTASSFRELYRTYAGGQCISRCATRSWFTRTNKHARRSDVCDRHYFRRRVCSQMYTQRTQHRIPFYGQQIFDERLPLNPYGVEPKTVEVRTAHTSSIRRVYR
jgi:hypothetical protein